MKDAEELIEALLSRTNSAPPNDRISALSYVFGWKPFADSKEHKAKVAANQSISTMVQRMARLQKTELVMRMMVVRTCVVMTMWMTVRMMVSMLLMMVMMVLMKIVIVVMLKVDCDGDVVEDGIADDEDNGDEGVF